MRAGRLLAGARRDRLCYQSSNNQSATCREAPVANVEWLLREATDERALPMSERTAIDDERWCATIERLEIGGGLRIFLTYAEVRRDIAIEARDNRTDRWMGSQVTISGSAAVDFLDGTQTHATANQALLFRPSGRRATYRLQAGATFHSAGYGLDVDRVLRLFDDDVPAVLRHLLEPEITPSRVVPMPSDRIMRGVAESLFGRGLNGSLRMLMMEGAVIQLLALQAAAAGSYLPARHRRGLSARERSSIREARERLLADMRRPPTLGELATAVGLTEKRLNTGFRLEFGTTVFGVLRNERLEHARIALRSDGISLKQVAFRVGYDHVTNFINAFAARYGAPPRQYLVHDAAMPDDASTATPRPQNPARRPA
jgi:AraC-like DNA-binding protein